MENGNASKVLPGVPVEFGGEKHVFLFDLYSLIKLHEVTGKNPLSKDFLGTVGPFDIAAMAWAGTLHEGHDLSPIDFGKKISPFDVMPVTHALLTAYVQGSPAEKKTEAQASTQPPPPPPETMAPTGSESSPTESSASA